MKPTKTGLIVPLTARLPKGYLRHYQADEHGTLLEPILTYENGEVVAPADAPPGLTK
ncbi:MAG: hypothetical protein ACT4TC_10575 [Myxococcaceae bacterium]